MATNGHLYTTAIFLADSPYIHPCFKLSTTATSHRSQTMTSWTRLSKVLFPKKSVKMIDGTEKPRRQLAFELQSSRVFERRSYS